MAASGDTDASKARTALAECVLNSSYKYCTLGIALAVPIGVKLKSYNPLVYLGISGTLADFLEGYSTCQEQREAYQKCIAKPPEQ
mmetsp:Transcript_29144/g.82168  ORF Transcript_29144/g.82168 Transcript_29144/m.82168 type:complete len:85 (-) Transcript_29144:142-396(-)